jgi:glycosyltransferase involved in cell wall biosynthesis
LIRAINSVLNQTYPVDEIIVCDDGSTDSTLDSINKLNNSKIVWIDCGRNGMPSIPRNIGINKSKGNWIAFLDSDDEWLPRKLEMQVEVILKNKILIVATNAYRIINDQIVGKYFNMSFKNLTFKKLIYTNYVICSTVLVNKEFLVKTSLFPIEKKMRAIEDYQLWLRLSLRANIHYLKTPLIYYFDEPNNSIRKDSLSETEIKNTIISSLLNWRNNVKIGTPFFDLDTISHLQQKSFKSNLFKFYLKFANRLGNIIN